MLSHTDIGSAVSMLEKWFREHCDRRRRHHLGITIETMDTAGWVLTFKELRLTKEALADIVGDLLREFDSQVATDGTMIRVLGPSLRQVLLAAAILAERSAGWRLPEKGDITD